jgi:predicted Zn-dependent peptidase
MNALRVRVPKEDLEQKRMDALNSFVFNVDSPAQLVGVYGRYYMRNEPLDTLERIQDTFMAATKDELRALAREFLDPAKLQIFVVADKTIPVGNGDGEQKTLEEDLQSLAAQLSLPYTEIPLR